MNVTSSPRRSISRRMLASLVGAMAVILIAGLLIPSGNGAPLQSAYAVPIKEGKAVAKLFK